MYLGYPKKVVLPWNRLQKAFVRFWLLFQNLISEFCDFSCCCHRTSVASRHSWMKTWFLSLWSSSRPNSTALCTILNFPKRGETFSPSLLTQIGWNMRCCCFRLLKSERSPYCYAQECSHTDTNPSIYSEFHIFNKSFLRKIMKSITPFQSK